MAVENKNNLTCYVDERLEEWGKWARQGESGGLYYSSMSNIAKISDAGGVFLERTCRNDEDNPRAEETDKLVTAMARTHPTEARVLFAYYVQTGTQEFLARRMKMSVRLFFNKIKIAKAWLDGRMSIKY